MKPARQVQPLPRRGGRHPLLQDRRQLVSRGDSAASRRLRAVRWTLVLGVCCLGLPGRVSGATLLAERPRADFWVTDGHVNAVLQANGVIYLGGRFNYLRPSRGTGIALDLATRETDLQFPQVNGVVSAAVSDGSGGFYLGGEFTEVGGLARTNLAYVLPDKTVDPTWNPGANGRVEAMVLAGRTLYAAGQFAIVGGQQRSGLAALDAFTGLTTGWNPGVDPSGSVVALATYRGHPIGAGSFVSMGGVPRNGLAMLDRNSAQATDWDPKPQGGSVRALAVDGDTVYVGGTFTNIGGQSRMHLAAVDAITGLAANWDPGASGTSARVEALALARNIVFAGGEFSKIGGAQVQSLVALDAATGLALPWNPSPIGEGLPVIHHLAVGEHAVYVAGTFTNISGLARSGFAALDIATDAALPWSLEFSGEISAIAISFRTVYAGGGVVNNGGVPRQNLAALEAATGLPTAWDPKVNGEVHALAAGQNAIYVGGDFSQLGGLTRSNLAAIDAVTGVPNFNWNPGANGAVRALAASSNLFIGGDFTLVGGQPRNHLASVLPNGLVSGWNPNASGPVRTVILAANSLYAGGEFQTVSGLGRSNLVELSLNGLPTAWNPMANGVVEALAVASNRVFAGGRFTQIGGQFRNRLALLDSLSNAAEPWNPNANGTVRSIAVSSNTVFVGGDFTTVGNQSRVRLAGIDAATGLPIAWNPSADDTVHALAATTSDLFVVGNFTRFGNRPQSGFAAFGPEGLPVIVTQPLSQMLAPNPNQNLSLNVAAIGTPPLSYQWQFNNTNIPGATGSALMINGVNSTHAGHYSVIVSNSFGQVRSADALLTVLVAPTITVQPLGQTNAPGQNIILSVAATGSPPPQYHWRLNGVGIPGGIGPTLTLSKPLPTNSGSYAVYLFSPAGVVRSAAADVVISAPNFPFSDFLVNSSVSALASGQFRGNNTSATAESGEPNHGGFVGGKSVWLTWAAPASGIAEFHTLGSGFDTVLAVYTNGPSGLGAVVSDDDRGGFRTSRVLFNAVGNTSYFVVVDGHAGGSGNLVLSWNLRVNFPPMPTIVAEPDCQVAADGSSVTFSVLANSPSPLTYQWYLGPHRLAGETGPTLTLAGVQPEDLGNYRVRVGNAGSIFVDSLPAALQLAFPTVFGPDFKFTDKYTFTSGPPPSFGVAPGTAERVTFSATETEGSATDPTPCQTVLWSSLFWRFNVTGPGAMIIDTEGSDIRTVLAVIRGDPPFHTEIACGVDTHIKFFPVPGTNYTLLVDGLRGARGRIQVNLRFCGTPQVNVSPTVPFVPFVRAGPQTILGVQVTNELCELTYQWYRNGTEIPGATYSRLTNDTEAIVGSAFSVVVSNCAGSATNLVATFLRLWVERTGSPTAEYRLRATPPLSHAYVVEDTDRFSAWDPFHTNPASASLNLLLDPFEPGDSKRFFRVRPPSAPVPP